MYCPERITEEPTSGTGVEVISIHASEMHPGAVKLSVLLAWHDGGDRMRTPGSGRLCRVVPVKDAKRDGEPEDRSACGQAMSSASVRSRVEPRVKRLCSESCRGAFFCRHICRHICTYNAGTCVDRYTCKPICRHVCSIYRDRHGSVRLLIHR